MRWQKRPFTFHGINKDIYTCTCKRNRNKSIVKHEFFKMQNTSTLLGLPMLYVKTTENSCSKQHALKMNIRSIINLVTLFFLSFYWLVSNDVIFININNLFVCFSALWQNPENVLETTCTEKSSERRRRNAFISGSFSWPKNLYLFIFPKRIDNRRR